MTKTNEYPPEKVNLLILLLLGGACIAFGQGRWPVPVAAWFAPVCLIAFVRRTPIWLGILAFTLVHAIGWEVAYSGMVKMPIAARWGLFLGLSLTLSLVYLVDRSVSRRFSGFWTTLVFPCGWVTFEYLNGRFSPSGSWASIAYTFTDHSSLLQIASLLGWTGITFLVGWVASVANWSWDRRRSGQPVRTGTLACASVLIAVLVFGGVRQWTFPVGPTIRVANVVGPSSYRLDGEFQDNVWAYTRGVEIPDTQIELARSQIRRTMVRHMELAERELRNGAEIVVFPEANPSISKAEESDFVAAASRLASKYEAYVGLGLFVFRPQDGLPAENKFVLVGPDGAVVWDYLKAKLVPGSSHVVGDGVLPVADAEFGRLSCAICFDMDFPTLLQQAGKNRTDILIAPSNDWPEVRATHARMAIMRAVEQGLNMVRPTKDGFSLVTDSMGRTIARQDTIRPGEHVLVADVPVSGVRTVYSVIGDGFSWLCIVVFGGALGLSIARRNGRTSPSHARN